MSKMSFKDQTDTAASSPPLTSSAQSRENVKSFTACFKHIILHLKEFLWQRGQMIVYMIEQDLNRIPTPEGMPNLKTICGATIVML